MDKEQTTEAQLTKENNTSTITIQKYVATIYRSTTRLGLVIAVIGLIMRFDYGMYIALGVFLVVINLCSGKQYLEFAEDSLAFKQIFFQHALVISYRKIKAIEISDNVIKLTLLTSKGDKTKKIAIRRFSKEDRQNIKINFSELKKQLCIE